LGRKKKAQVRDEQLKNLDKFQDILAKVPKSLDAIMKIGLAAYGIKTFEHPAGALVALLALELAKSENIVAGASGVGTLALMGIAGARETQIEGFKEVPFRHGPRALPAGGEIP